MRADEEHRGEGPASTGTADDRASGIENELAQDKRVLEILNETGAAVASKLDLDRVVQVVTDAATELAGAQFGAFFYTAKDDQGDVFTLYALSGAPREAFDSFGHPHSTPLFGPTFRGEGVIRIGDVHRDPRFGKVPPHHGLPPGHLPVRSYLAVPVVARSGEVLGGLFFGHEEADVFTERAERLVVGIAAQAAIAVDNARLYQQARRAAEERAHLLEAERAARSEVERASRVKDEFFATLSHELRTPLNAVLGWAKILLEGTDAATTKHGLETIVRNAGAQLRLVEELLDMNLVVAGKLRVDSEPVELAEIVERAVESIRPVATSKGITLDTAIDRAVGIVSGDANRLQQVVWNLLNNAVKFTPEGGNVAVAVVAAGSQAEVVVRDDGIGIAPDFLPHLFERFRQHDSSTTRRFGGLGLGLSIVRQLVELHGGDVRAESAGPGRGSTFRVRLPRIAQRRSEPVRDSQAPPKPRRGRERALAGVSVLVVDDESDARELARFVLEAAGARVSTAASADEALQVLRAERPQALVSDIGMPYRDGYDLVRSVRALGADEGGLTPALALTAFASADDRTRALGAGYQLHATKPIDPQQLVELVKTLAGAKHAATAE